MKDLGLDPVIDIWLPPPEPSPETNFRSNSSGSLKHFL
jgi:hypothetical protein